MIEKLIKDFKDGKRAALARAITLVESSNPDHKKDADTILESLVDSKIKSKRLGISGTPGVGKSTFIETFGMHLIGEGHKVAVLAIDPSSEITGGSILGDKTRMASLSTNENAFVRPSPSSSTLGGVGISTKESILLCEAFGFDYIIIETVGVGQSETTVSKLVDYFMLLMQPASGDELQGIKRGVLEFADIVVVNKADGDLLAKAKLTKAMLDSSLSILRGSDFPIHLCSGLKGDGVDELYKALEVSFSELQKSGKIEDKRIFQNTFWLYDALMRSVDQKVKADKDIKKLIDDISNKTSIIKQDDLKKLLGKV
ncbi:MAG: methylmalonyl Co-A mutase-associated GTPase MeaB [Bacteriovoracaceae bacterium]|jgi:LAO/AO transport system kinase|nr:methylmalonyl Co-A mutase-associated GTPase MeaB [Bacteriovoracaceae bacterium]